MKIKVKPEGREGIWLVSKQEIIDFLLNYEYDTIHNYIAGGPAVIGVDWSKKSIIEKINESEMIAILTGEAFKHNLRHALSVIANNELYMFDIGEIQESDLDDNRP